MRRMPFALLLLVLALGAQPLVATYLLRYVTANLALHEQYQGEFSCFSESRMRSTRCPQVPPLTSAPGTYAEQVVISQPLTLRGVSYNSSGNWSQVVSLCRARL